MSRRSWMQNGATDDSQTGQALHYHYHKQSKPPPHAYARTRYKLNWPRVRVGTLARPPVLVFLLLYNCSTGLNTPISQMKKSKWGLSAHKQPLRNGHNLFLVLHITPLSPVRVLQPPVLPYKWWIREVIRLAFHRWVASREHLSDFICRYVWELPSNLQVQLILITWVAFVGLFKCEDCIRRVLSFLKMSVLWD